MHRFVTGSLLSAALICSVFTLPLKAQTSGNPLPPDPDLIIETIGITEGMTIGEAGAGNGYFTFPLAEAVGKTGRIYANDIDPEALTSIDNQCAGKDVHNITTVLGEVDDPLFPVKNLDMVVMRYVFHDLIQPVAWMEHVVPYLKPGSAVVIVDMERNKAHYHGEHPYLSEEQLVAIMARTGFTLERIDHRFLIDNIYVYRLPDTASGNH